MLEEKNNNEEKITNKIRSGIHQHFKIIDYSDKNDVDNLFSDIYVNEDTFAPDDSDIVYLYLWHDHIEVISRLFHYNPKYRTEKMLYSIINFKNEYSSCSINLKYGEAKKFLEFLHYEKYKTYSGEVLYKHLSELTAPCASIIASFRYEIWTKREDFKPFRYNELSD